MARKHNEARSIISSEGAAAPPVTHRRSVRASVTPSVASEPAPEPSKPEAVVAEPTPAPISEQEEIARLAYSYWEARGCQGGSPEEDWARAEQEIRNLRHAAAK